MLEIKTDLDNFTTQPLQKIVCYDGVIYAISAGNLEIISISTGKLIKRIVVSERDTLLCLLVSDDIIVLAGTGIANIYKRDTLDLISSLTLPQLSCISAIGLFNDTIYLSDISCKLFIFDTQGKLLDTFCPDKPVSCYAVSFSEGRWIIGTAFQEIRVFDLISKIEITSFSLNRTAIFAISCYKNNIALACEDRSVQIYNIEDKPIRIRRWLGYHSSRVYGVVWSQDGRYIYSCGEDCAVYRFDVNSDSEVLSVSDLTPEVAISPVSLSIYESSAFLSLGNSLIYRYDLCQSTSSSIPYNPAHQITQLTLDRDELQYTQNNKVLGVHEKRDFDEKIIYFDKDLDLASFGRYTLYKGDSYNIKPVIKAIQADESALCLCTDHKLVKLANMQATVIATNIVAFAYFEGNVIKANKSGVVSTGNSSIKLKKPIVLTVHDDKLLCYTKNNGVYNIRIDSNQLTCSKITRYGNISGVFDASGQYCIGIDPSNPHKLKVASCYPFYAPASSIECKIASLKCPVAFSETHVAIITSNSISINALQKPCIYRTFSCNREILCSCEEILGTEDGSLINIKTRETRIVSTGSIRSITKLESGIYVVTGAQSKIMFVNHHLDVISETHIPTAGVRVMCCQPYEGSLLFGDSVGDIWSLDMTSYTITKFANIGSHCVYYLTVRGNNLIAVSSWGQIHNLTTNDTKRVSKSACYNAIEVLDDLFVSCDDGYVHSLSGRSIQLTNSSIRYITSHNNLLYAVSWDHFIYVLDTKLELIKKIPHTVYAANTLSFVNNELVVSGFGYEKHIV